MNPHKVTRDFERALCDYTGARFAVAVNSCTMALTLSVAWCISRREFGVDNVVEIPRLTYVSVPMAIIHAGGKVAFRDDDWSGYYRLNPFPVWDSARLFTSGMYPFICATPLPSRPGELISVPVSGFACVSFHASKTLGLEQGGAILHDSEEADAWLRRARFDGRTEGVAPIDDSFDMIGWHCYMNPSTAAQGILKLHSLPRYNKPLPNDDYPDLSAMSIFR